MRYVALLRGINVGGHKPVKMADLRAAFGGMAFENARTVQASGNVAFEAGGEEDADRLATRIEAELRRIFGYPVGVIVRPLEDLKRLVASDPFRGVAANPQTRLYVTFLSHPADSGFRIGPDMNPEGSLDTAGGNVRLVDVRAAEVLTAITLSPKWGTTELMAWLDKEFGAAVTTRNWNTILKIVGG